MRKTTLSELHPDSISTIKKYASAAARRDKDVFGREHFGHWELGVGGGLDGGGLDGGNEEVEVTGNSTVYVGTVTPAVHFTMGGVVISPKGEVLTADGMGIQGLWAAGEVTGGVHGGNRLGGSSLLECVVFGRIVGEEAARYVSV